MNSKYGLIHGFHLTGSGEGVPLDAGEISPAFRDEQLAWLHFDATNPASRQLLEKEMGHLDQIILTALFADGTRPRILEFEKGTLLILRGMNLSEDAEPGDMISIRLWIEKDLIISIQRRPLKVVVDLRERLVIGKGPKSSGDFISMLAGRLFERMEPVFSELDERLDTIEENVIEEPDTKDRQEISTIRKQAIMFRRYIAPQRDVIAHLRVSEQEWLEIVHKRRLQESLDHVMRYVEELDTIRERAQIVKDELANAISDRMNKNLYMLSIVAAIFLPLGFLTGLLGINLGGIPGAESGYAFFVFCGILVVVVSAQMLVFKKLKWL